MKISLKKLSQKEKLMFSIITLLLCICLTTVAVFDWLAINENPNMDGLDVPIVNSNLTFSNLIIVTRTFNNIITTTEYARDEKK